MSEYSFILDEIVWSYSSLNTFVTCPYSFYLRYIMKKSIVEQAFAQFGSLCHKVLEEYYKGNLLSFELSDQYNERFDTALTARFTYNKYTNLRDSFYDKGFNAFENFNDIAEGQKILAVEHKYNFNIGQYKFTGNVDLELLDESTSEYTIVDHKTKKKLHFVRTSKKRNLITMADGRFIPIEDLYQMYLYCIPFKEFYGAYPKYLKLNMLCIDDIYTIAFNQEHMDRAVLWANDTIERIYQATDFLPENKIDEFNCNNICSSNCWCNMSKFYAGDDLD